MKTVKASLISTIQNHEGINVISGEIEIDNAALLKDLSFQLRDEVENLFLVLGANIGGKPILSVMISENLVGERNLNAAMIVREAGKEIKGGGGGQPFYATAGGKDATGIASAIRKALAFL
jgi:alanyl-tRNA synthetase